MEKLVAELKKMMKFKREVASGDLVLIVSDNPQSAVYAQVADIERDSAKAEEWWHLSMVLLTVPPQHVTWTLRTAQFDGSEIFTMGGEKRFIAPVALPAKTNTLPPEPIQKKKPALRVVK